MKNGAIVGDVLRQLNDAIAKEMNDKAWKSLIDYTFPSGDSLTESVELKNPGKLWTQNESED
jgi:hypothetical protein